MCIIFKNIWKWRIIVAKHKISSLSFILAQLYYFVDFHGTAVTSRGCVQDVTLGFFNLQLREGNL